MPVCTPEECPRTGNGGSHGRLRPRPSPREYLVGGYRPRPHPGTISRRTTVHTVDIDGWSPLNPDQAWQITLELARHNQHRWQLLKQRPRKQADAETANLARHFDPTASKACLAAAKQAEQAGAFYAGAGTMAAAPERVLFIARQCREKQPPPQARSGMDTITLLCGRATSPNYARHR